MTVRELVTTLGFKVNDKGLNKYNQALDNVKTRVNSMSSAFLSAGKIIAGAVATAGITALGKSILQTSSEVEQYRVSLGAMIGDQEKANKIIHNLDYSPVSDFYGTANAIGGLQGMVTFGMQAEQASDTLTRLGDIAQGNSEAFKSLSLNMGQVFAKGKADATDLKQFVQQGFDVVGEVSKITGKSREQIEKAGVSYEQCALALQSVTNAGGKYYQMLQKQSQTLPGLVRQFQSLTSAIKESIGNNVLDNVKNILNYFIKLGKSFQTNIVDIGTKAFNSLLKSVVGVIGTIEILAMRTNKFKGLRTLIGSIVSIVNVLWDSLLHLFIKIAPYLDIFMGKIAQIITIIFKDIKNLISILSVGFNAILNIFNSFFKFTKIGQFLANIFNTIYSSIGSLNAVANAIEIIGGAILAVIATLKIYNIVMGVVNTLNAIFNAILIANPVGLIIAGIMLLIVAIGLLVKNWDKVKQVFSNFGKWCKSFFTSIVAIVKNIWNSLILFFNTLITAVKNIFISIWTKIVDFIASVVSIIKNVWNTITNFFASLWENAKAIFISFVQWCSNIFTNPIEAIKNVWNTITNFFASLWENAKAIFISFTEWIVQLFTNPIEAIKNVWNSVIDIFVNIVENVKNTFFNGIETIKNKIFGFWNSIKDIFEKIGKFFGFGDGEIDVNYKNQTPNSNDILASTAGVSNTYATAITNNMNSIPNVTNNNQITIKVPEGTSAEQARAISEMVNNAIDESWNSVINSSRSMIPTPEARSY